MSGNLIYFHLLKLFLEPSNETMQITNDPNLTLESRLSAVVLLFTLVLAVSLLVCFYKEVAGKPSEKNMVTGILLGI